MSTTPPVNPPTARVIQWTTLLQLMPPSSYQAQLVIEWLTYTQPRCLSSQDGKISKLSQATDVFQGLRQTLAQAVQDLKLSPAHSPRHWTQTSCAQAVGCNFAKVRFRSFESTLMRVTWPSLCVNSTHPVQMRPAIAKTSTLQCRNLIRI